jgi:hypothetical protein
MSQILDYLKQFKGKKGLYIIKVKNIDTIQKICSKLGYNFNDSNVAYVGKAEKCLYSRAKQEMGWANFEAATFVKKMGLFLDFDIKDKKNKSLQQSTRDFILDHFTIECVEVEDNVQQEETEFIKDLKPCLNVKKI